MKTFGVLILISTVSAFDYIRESFKFIDDQTDPCENFYRHACPIKGIDDFRLNKAYSDLIFELKSKTANAVWKNLKFEETFKRTHFKEMASPNSFIAGLFEEQCEDENVTREELSDFVNQIERVLLGPGESECQHEKCLSALAFDNDCARVSQKLQQILSNYLAVLDMTQLFLNNINFNIEIVKIGLDGANAVLDGDVRDGIQEVDHILESMKTKLISWINQTAWAENNDAVDAIIIEALQVNLYDNFGNSMRENYEYLFKTEQKYLECIGNTKNDENHQVFCMFIALAATMSTPINKNFYTYFNAENGHPNLYFSHLLYDMAKNVEEYAGVLGGVGYIAGHELSHTLIEDASSPELLPYFSNESMQCIQNQFQKSCDSFKEVSCGVRDNQIDENGSDMLGCQLAYSLFEDAYEGRMKDVYIKIASSNLPDSYQSITMEQLFFYSIAFTSCRAVPLQQYPGNPHSPFNIRINAIAQHPGFRKAFNCASDSPMVQSFNDQCIIFGEGAPETRR